jgi:Ca2+-transporting ATPase
MTAEQPPAVLPVPHRLSVAETYRLLATSRRGLAPAEASARRARYGANSLPRARPPGVLAVLARQFASPLIYILLAAAAVSAFSRDWSDAGFILAVLVLNAAIGAIQEFNAERSAEALRSLVVARARVGEDYEIAAEDVVPGDVVAVEAGVKVPADARLVSDEGLEVDESLLTGESVPVVKQAGAILGEHTAIGDRTNMLFAGTLVTRGRAYGVVVATGESPSRSARRWFFSARSRRCGGVRSRTCSSWRWRSRCRRFRRGYRSRSPWRWRSARAVWRPAR